MGSNGIEEAPPSPKHQKAHDDAEPRAATVNSCANPAIPNTTATNAIDIDTLGDVVFYLNDSTTIRVHSSILRLISKPFAAIFGFYSSEGQNLSSTPPKAIPLLEDDPAAMTYLCRVTHRRHVRESDFTTPPQFDLFLSLAFLSFKYDCVSGLSLELASWFDNHLQRITSEAVTTATAQATSSQLGKLLVTASHLDSPRAFRAASRALMLHHAGSFWKVLCMLTADELSQLPERTFMALTEQVASTKRKMSIAISERYRDVLVMGLGDDLRRNVLNYPKGPSSECTGGRRCSSLTAALLVVEDIMPPEELSLVQWPPFYMRQDLSGFEETYVEQTSQHDVCDNCDFRYRDIGKELELAAEWAASKMKGLCLDCLKDKEKWGEGEVCQEDHRASHW
ncbi:hypothetical protein SLS56_001750 [Neofusicoccum ribis]|uniref:BTB domain-containing protein n=1 Tax=Neofusicoccum ribis TaxID=45134 RepID=A0ABR3T747_9PEZI